MIRVASWLPCGVCGDWEIRRRKSDPTITELVQHVGFDEWLWMDDADTELASHREILEVAHGDVLLLGLGLGFLPMLLSGKPSVRSLTILENSREVSSLVVPWFIPTILPLKPVSLIETDARTWNPSGRLYDVLWIDPKPQPIPDIERPFWDAITLGWASSVVYWRV